MSLKDRVKQNFDAKDKGLSGGKWILDMSKFDDVKFFSPKEGRNAIDIIPYKVSSDKHPSGLKKGEEDYVLDIWVHRMVGQTESTVLCLKKTYAKPCPVCEELAAMRQGEQNEELIRQLRPTRRCAYNVLDLNDSDKGVQLFWVSHFLFEKELLEEAMSDDGEVIAFPDLKDGRTIKFKVVESQIGKQNFSKFKNFQFEKRDPYDASVFDEVYPLDEMLIVPDYSSVKKLLYGESEEKVESEKDSEKDSEKEDKQPRRLTRGTAGRKTKEDDSQDDKESQESGKRERKKSVCPYDHTFGDDCDKYDDDCSRCEVWEQCADEYDKRTKKGKD